jgi:hypothetical protein
MNKMWISAEEVLPELFQNVLVFGRCEQINVLHQIYQARRWCGTPHLCKGFNWLTPCDAVITNVTYWMYIPDGIKDPFAILTQCCNPEDIPLVRKVDMTPRLFDLKQDIVETHETIINGRLKSVV